PDFVIKQIDLSDLSFLQYVILELKKPAYDKSIYKGAVLAKALQCKKTLLTHHVSDWQKGSFAVFCGGLIFFQSWICLIGASSFLLSEYIADWRLTKKLEEELALKFNNGKIAKLDDHDAKINKFVKVGANGVQAVEKSLEYLTHIPKK
ncbi:MAG TPA: hypothetical protein VHM20_04035, partial [Gammaproteobacteria bacterium]|nr:hypothetical protein [Gammaproteobacteria bacterium]